MREAHGVRRRFPRRGLFDDLPHSRAIPDDRRTSRHQVRFDIEGSSATINYSLDAAFRGRGLATAIVDTAIRTFREEFGDVETIIAFVKPDNVASCRVFEKLDFEADGFDGKMQANRYHIDLAGG